MFKVKAAPALAHQLRARRRKEGRTLELVGTLATITSLRSRGGGGKLRSREPTYLVGAVAAVLISSGGHIKVAERVRERVRER
jgi:hypothetical protein